MPSLPKTSSAAAVSSSNNSTGSPRAEKSSTSPRIEPNAVGDENKQDDVSVTPRAEDDTPILECCCENPIVIFGVYCFSCTNLAMFFKAAYSNEDGQHQLEKKNYSEAIRLFKKAHELEPYNEEYLWNMIVATISELLSEEKYTDATDLVTDSLTNKRFMDEYYNGVLYNLLGDICYRQKKYAKALENVKKALQLQPANEDTQEYYLLTCREYTMELRAEKKCAYAVEFLSKAEKLESDEKNKSLQNLLEEAIKHAEAESCNETAGDHFKKGNYSEAYRFYKEAHEIDPETEQYLCSMMLARAEILVSEEKYTEAAELVTEKLKNAPFKYEQHNGGLHNCLGYIDDSQNNYEKALSNYKKAVQLNTHETIQQNYVNACCNYAKELHAEKKDAAVEFLRKAEKLESDENTVSDEKNKVLQNLLEEAIKHAEAESCHETGGGHLENGNYSEALHFYKEALELDPDNEQYLCNMIHARVMELVSEEKYTEAIDLVTEKLKNVDMYNCLGWINYSQKKYEKALVNVKKALQLNPESETIQQNYVGACRQLTMKLRVENNSVAAIEFLSKAEKLKSDEKNKSLQNLLEEAIKHAEEESENLKKENRDLAAEFKKKLQRDLAEREQQFRRREQELETEKEQLDLAAEKEQFRRREQELQQQVSTLLQQQQEDTELKKKLLFTGLQIQRENDSLKKKCQELQQLQKSVENLAAEKLAAEQELLDLHEQEEKNLEIKEKELLPLQATEFFPRLLPLETDLTNNGTELRNIYRCNRTGHGKRSLMLTLPISVMSSSKFSDAPPLVLHLFETLRKRGRIVPELASCSSYPNVTSMVSSVKCSANKNETNNNNNNDNDTNNNSDNDVLKVEVEFKEVHLKEVMKDFFDQHIVEFVGASRKEFTYQICISRPKNNNNETSSETNAAINLNNSNSFLQVEEVVRSSNSNNNKTNISRKDKKYLREHSTKVLFAHNNSSRENCEQAATFLPSSAAASFSPPPVEEAVSCFTQDPSYQDSNDWKPIHVLRRLPNYSTTPLHLFHDQDSEEQSSAAASFSPSKPRNPASRSSPFMHNPYARAAGEEFIILKKFTLKNKNRSI